MAVNTYHVGLCMAGSVSAGAYTAGVVDYLHEALEAWELAKKNKQASLPSHDVVIDLLGGSSGGGITAALAYFALRSKVKHGTLDSDGRSYNIDPAENIYWRTWVELTGNDMLTELLEEDDLQEGYIASLLNSSFVDKVADIFEAAIKTAGSDPVSPDFIHDKAELFLTLFNVTGIKYEINSKSSTAKSQYLSEHRDIAHFQWGDTYEGDGRMEISFKQTKNLKTLLASAKATGAFPAGLSARMVSREAKYIWENPIFRKNGKFQKSSIKLGEHIQKDTDIYTSINGDGGTANNEPVEFCRNLMLDIRINDYKDIVEGTITASANETQLAAARKELSNSSVILIDPFPSYDFELIAPEKKFAHLVNYVPKFILSLASQLIFDAKDAFEAYNKDSYGLHVIAPSKEGVPKPEYAIACGSLGGFGGFFTKEFRVHDFFLGRHNAQSFLRKYFVVDINEDPASEGYDCVQSVINGYKDNPEAVDRFGYIDENGRCFVPIIPDVTMQGNITVTEIVNADQERQVKYNDPSPLPLYQLHPLRKDHFAKCRDQLKERIRKIINSLFDSNIAMDLIINVTARAVDDKIADKVIEFIIEDLEKRDLIK